ncbi:hypothetical protein [Sphingobium cupriresistens]|uniref:Uncharacterized protein n=1 Tax=Sphingobium cupriresistens LL01 TaxID=1420583 RepID=A0A0J7Y5M9_9SPHN|nr:hypothetical protein [Sphingobium cupriresistens]KMS58693.1 hypothetical protein V473_02595 [Sphingobium cupriresistens LL01]
MTDVRLTVPTAHTFMVARKGRTMRPGSTLPRLRYQTLDAASTAAETEAAANPGRVMIVFQEVLRAKAEADHIPAAAPSPRRPGEPGDIPPMSPGSKGGA